MDGVPPKLSNLVTSEVNSQNMFQIISTYTAYRCPPEYVALRDFCVGWYHASNVICKGHAINALVPFGPSTLSEIVCWSANTEELVAHHGAIDL